VEDERRDGHGRDFYGLDLSKVTWFAGPRDPEPCTIFARDTRSTTVERAWFCGCVFDEAGNLIDACECPTNELLVCGRCWAEAYEGVWAS
jgi:hypothetical protein